MWLTIYITVYIAFFWFCWWAQNNKVAPVCKCYGWKYIWSNFCFASPSCWITLWYCISGTSADIMKVGGYKLSALEIESALLEVLFLISAALIICFLSQLTFRLQHFIFPFVSELLSCWLWNMGGIVCYVFREKITHFPCFTVSRYCWVLCFGLAGQRLWRCCVRNYCSRWSRKKKNRGTAKACSKLGRTPWVG